MDLGKLHDRFFFGLKGYKDKALVPILRFLAYLKFTPNFVSFLSLVFGLIAVYFLLTSLLWFYIFLIISLIFDVLDGSLARYLKKTSKNAYWIDYLIDRFVYILVMGVVLYQANEYQFYYGLALGLYLISHLFFIISKRKFSIIFTRTIYFIILVFSSLAATFWVLGMSAINIVRYLIFAFQNRR